MTNVDRDNPFALLSERPVRNEPTPREEPAEREQVAEREPARQSAASPTPAAMERSRRKPGRPRVDRPNRMTVWASNETYAWIQRLEHTPRTDGRYFTSQAELVEQLLRVAKRAIDDGSAAL